MNSTKFQVHYYYYFLQVHYYYFFYEVDNCKDTTNNAGFNSQYSALHSQLFEKHIHSLSNLLSNIR